MIGEFLDVKIQGMAAAVPSYIEDNTNYVSVLGERRIKKQIRLTGVSKRHISAPRQKTSDLCYAAAVPLIDKLKWDKKQIKVLIFITQGPSFHTPSTAFFLQKRLGLEKDCVAFDINLGCSSFTSGVHVVSSLLQKCNISDKALLLIGDTCSKIMRPEGKITAEGIADRMLFGSAGAAIALEKVEQHSLKFMNCSDGNGYDAIIQRFKRPSEMDGERVFEFAINTVAEDVNEFRRHFDIRDDDIDYYVFHQAQKLILDNIVAVCKISDEKELRSLDEYGNTSGTSVPVTVCANLDKFKDKESVKMLLCGFGIGLSWGIIFTEIPTENILPIIECDECCEEYKRPAKGLEDKYILITDADTEMGEMIGRYLGDKSAKVILMGQDEDKLERIQTDLNVESFSIVGSFEKDLNKIVAFCEEKNIELNGITLFEHNMKFMLDSMEFKQFLKKGLIAQNVSMVLLSNLEKSIHQDNSDTSTKAKTVVNQWLLDMQKGMEMEGARINAVSFDRDKLDLRQITGTGQAWIDDYILSGCQVTKKKQLYIGKAVKYLLSDESEYTTGTIIPINL